MYLFPKKVYFFVPLWWQIDVMFADDMRLSYPMDAYNTCGIINVFKQKKPLPISETVTKCF